MVYEDILMMGVSTRNVERVIRLVLQKVARVKVDRLLSECFARYILWRLVDLHSIRLYLS